MAAVAAAAPANPAALPPVPRLPPVPPGGGLAPPTRQTSTGVYTRQDSSGKEELYWQTSGGEFVKQESLDRDRGKRHQALQQVTSQADNHPLMVGGINWDSLG